VSGVRRLLKLMNKFKEIVHKVFTTWLWLIIPLIALDQGTKLAAHFNEWNITLIPNFLYLTYTRNTGGAWSILSGNMAFLAVISAVAFIAIFLFYLKNLTKQNTFKRILFAVILAGTLGNFIDRAFYKLFLGSEGVVDFIHFRFGTYDFPIFNVADILLTLGIITFAVLITIEDFKNKKLTPKEEEKEGNTDEVNQDSKHSQE